MRHRDASHPDNPPIGTDDNRDAISFSHGDFPVDQQIVQLAGAGRPKRLKSVAWPAVPDRQRPGNGTGLERGGLVT
jgi:hypothetical protein